MGKKKTNRARGFGCIVYPESAPDNWREILDEHHIMWAESPLHDLDVNPTGEVKKPHWHVLLAFDAPKTLDQIKELVEPLNGSNPIILDSIRGTLRYFAHLDNPEKHQYNPALIVGHGGIDIKDLLRVSASKRYSLIAEMRKWVKQNDIEEYADLVDYAATFRNEDWLPLLSDNSTYVMIQYIKSNKDRIRKRRDELCGKS